MNYHQPVLLSKTLEILDVKKNKVYIDATLGNGGHTLEILKLGGIVYGLDQDPKNIEISTERIKKENLDSNFTSIYSNFNKLEKIVKNKIGQKVDGLFFDLGLSNNQQLSQDRGFSFNDSKSLDMRLDPKTQKVTAEKIINTAHFDQLYEIFTKNSQEIYSKPLILKIIRERQKKPITDAKRLADIIRDYYKQNNIRTRIDPSTKIFLSLKIAVNQEFSNLKKVLLQSLNIVKSGGVVCFITFHSGEDRIVKQFIKEKVRQKQITIISKAISTSFQENKKNPLSRSAILRSYKIV